MDAGPLPAAPDSGPLPPPPTSGPMPSQAPQAAHGGDSGAQESGPLPNLAAIPQGGPTNLLTSLQTTSPAEAIQNLTEAMKNPSATFQLGEYGEDLVKQGGRQAGSLVSTVLSPLSWPARVETAAVVKAGSLLGVPHAQELEAQMMPQGSDLKHRWLPDAYLSDVYDFYDDMTPEGQAAKSAATGARAAFYGTRALNGFLINLLTDPINLVNIGSYSRAASELQKVGSELDPLTGALRGMDAAANERNLLSIRTPFTAPSSNRNLLELPMSTVQPAVDMIRKVPGVEQLAGVLRRFSPDTGNYEIDMKTTSHAGLGAGQGEVAQGIAKGFNMAKFSPEEQGLMSTILEKTPNIPGEIPKDILKAAPYKWADEASVRGQMRTLLNELPGAQTLAPGRAEQMIEHAVMIKKMGAADLADHARVGLLDSENVAKRVLDNYLPHVVDPSYRGMRLVKRGAFGKSVAKTSDEVAKELLERQASLENQATSSIKGSWLSSTDPVRYRSMSRGMTIPEANAAAMEKYGVKNFFVTNPMHAALIRRLETQKLVRDKELLDTVAKYGTRLQSGEKAPYGWSEIHHPDFNPKTVILKEGETLRKFPIRGMVFPNEIATKIDHYVNTPAVGNVMAQFQGLNRIFRATSFLTPGFWARNSADNMVKSFARGVTPETYVDTLKLIAGKLEGVRGQGTYLNRAGKFYSAEDLKNIFGKWGVMHGNSLEDGVGDVLSAGKKLTLSQVMSSPRSVVQSGMKYAAQQTESITKGGFSNMGVREALAQPKGMGIKYSVDVAKAMMRGTLQFGEKSENFTRMAYMMQRLKDGYTEEGAHRDMVQYLFDYSRNSPWTDKARFVAPFFQHPMKTLLKAPELIGGAPGVYNQLHNEFPHVLAKAFHDPVTQDALSQLMPDYLKSRDAVAGPLFVGNTLMADWFRNPKTPGNIGSLMYFDPAVGMRILNHFNYASEDARHMNYGLSPIFGSFIRAISWQTGAKDEMGRNLDEATVSHPDWANRVNYFVRNSLEGTFAFHNAWQIMKNQFGLSDAKYMEPATVSIMKGMAGQFVGVTNLDKDFFYRNIALGSQRAELVKNLRIEWGRENNMITNKWGIDNVSAEAPIKTYQNLQAKLSEMNANASASQMVQHQITAADYASRIKAIDQALRDNNRAYRFSATRYIQMNLEKQSHAQVTSGPLPK